MEIIYRKGRKEDSLRLAELTSIASGGVIEYLFLDVVPGMTPIQIVAQNLESDNFPHSYRNAFVAEFDQMVVGMALSFPSYCHRITQEMRAFFPRERLDHLKSFYASRVEDSLFLDAMAVEPGFRGKGIGSELISLTKMKAKESGYGTLSLIVLAENTNAQRLYERHGFEVVARVDLQPHELIPHQGGCLLMGCNLSQVHP